MDTKTQLYLFCSICMCLHALPVPTASMPSITLNRVKLKPETDMQLKKRHWSGSQLLQPPRQQEHAYVLWLHLETCEYATVTSHVSDVW